MFEKITMRRFAARFQKLPALLTCAMAASLLLFIPMAVKVAGASVAFTDDSGAAIVVDKRPVQVVSLVPGITEIIFRLGAGDAVAGITYHSTHPPGVSGKTIVGGFFSPSIPHIENLHPDVIFYSRIQTAVKARFAGTDALLVNLEIDGLADSYNTIRLLGEIFGREIAALDIIEENESLLSIVSRKVAKIPPDRRRRVIRLMGRDRIMSPGDDSFQNELIRAAGGIPPKLRQTGAVVPVSLDQWRAFNPQFVYGCSGDTAVAKRFFTRNGWRDVDAVKTGAIRYFPCDLTCRCATHTGYFVSWLSASIYGDLYGNSAFQVLENGIRYRRPLSLSAPYVRAAVVAHSKMDDFDNKTLIVDFNRPMSVVSTLEGQRSGIHTVGNHYASPPCWGIGHNRGLDAIRSRVYPMIGCTKETASFLFTGADMDNLSVQTQQFKAMRVHALVTAGVRSNAVRMSKDTGNYYEPGTINIILLPEMKLTDRAMTRAIISATEAKTAALLDMDVRSSAAPGKYRATGTGTDNIIVVAGNGTLIDNAGGHTKMGELIARAVYNGVREAVYRQNAMVPARNVFQRLSERRISVFDLVDQSAPGTNGRQAIDLSTALEAVLLEPRYADLVHTALAVSDDYEKGLIRDLTAFRAACRQTAETIAGRALPPFTNLLARDDLPPVMAMALNALLNGVYHRIVH